MSQLGHPEKAMTVPFSSSELFPTSLTARLCYQMGIVPRSGARLGCGASAVRCVPGGAAGLVLGLFSFLGLFLARDSHLLMVLRASCGKAAFLPSIPAIDSSLAGCKEWEEMGHAASP